MNPDAAIRALVLEELQRALSTRPELVEELQRTLGTRPELVEEPRRPTLDLERHPSALGVATRSTHGLEELQRVLSEATQPEREVLSADETAEFLGVDRKTVYDYANRGIIPHRRIGRRILFSRTRLVAWLGACKSASTGKG